MTILDFRIVESSQKNMFIELYSFSLLFKFVKACQKNGEYFESTKKNPKDVENRNC